MKYVVWILMAVILIAVGFIVFMPSGPSLKDVEPLKNPHISNLPDQKMMVVRIKGNPDKTAGKAFKLLFKAYYKLDCVSKTNTPTPCARWFAEDMSVPETWEGEFAVPIPDNVEKLPVMKNESGLTLAIAVWHYGEVAEILHVGPYNTEKPTSEKLCTFIDSSGYEITGLHEEEYLKGPGILPSNPKKYLTIIRYQVKKKLN